jgi:hypothetical protein
MNTKDYWKIFNADKSIMILTDVPKNYRNGDGVYRLMKCLQKIYGNDLCGTQKFDERFDKIEDFDIILRTGYNLDGNRLLSAHLFEYDRKRKTIKVDNGRERKLCDDCPGYVYKIRQTKISAQYGWDGFRAHILWTMGEDSCYRHWGDTQFGKQDIVPTENIFPS